MKKRIILFIVLAFALAFFALPQCAAQAQEIPLFDELGELFFPSAAGSAIKEKVYVSGKPVGITVDGEGVTVIGLNEYVTEGGVASPAAEAGLSIGDLILELDGKKIHNVAQLSKISSESKGRELTVIYKRDGKVHSAVITPKIDVLTKTHKLGVWVKDSASGIGTLTYIRNNLQFGCLGHPILDPQSKEIIKIKEGSLYSCEIKSVVKGEKGAAGELKGSFTLNDKIGTLYVNNKFGVYGNINKLPDDYLSKLFYVAPMHEIKQGAAHIITTVEGSTPKAYSIEIIKVVPQTKPDDKGLVIRITDKELLEKTGGIVQGMSGSPIIQNGKFVGAVTHVFVNDPTKGYGVLAQWMLQN